MGMELVRWITEKGNQGVYGVSIDRCQYCDIISLYSATELSETKAVLRWFC